MTSQIESAVKQAQKILGDKGKIPKYSPTITKSGDHAAKVLEEFNKVREEMNKDEVEKAHLSLDPHNKDDQKKIQEATKILTDCAQYQMNVADFNLKNLKELDKHLMNVGGYTHGG